MRKKLIFIAGLGVGYVLGTRAGREKYEDFMNAFNQVWDRVQN